MGDPRDNSSPTTDRTRQTAGAMAPILAGLGLMTVSSAVDASPWHRLLQVTAAILCLIGVYVIGKQLRTPSE
ncbi:hypothetical protein ACQP1U_09845 [Actinomycetota bacterium]